MTNNERNTYNVRVIPCAICRTELPTFRTSHVGTRTPSNESFYRFPANIEGLEPNVDMETGLIHVCHNCMNNHPIETCRRCDKYHLLTRMKLFEDDRRWYCAPCYEYQSTHYMSMIRDYGYKPTPKFKRLSTDTAQDPSFGIELEVEMSGSSEEPEDASHMIRGEVHYSKHDGSLSEGFEIVTHPMSEAWIRKNKEYFASRLKKLREMGYRSNQTDTCGMHVHISKDIFTTTHLYKFMKFFYDYQNFIVAISQRRSRSNLERWAKFGMGSVNDISHMAKRKRNGDRYTAINLTNDRTVEVRIFKGTLAERSFFKNLEFLWSLLSFTKLMNRDKITLANYYAFISANENRYPNLVSWLTESDKKLERAGVPLFRINTKELVTEEDN